MTKANSKKHDCRTAPTDSKSPTFKVTVPILDGTETVTQVLHFLEVVKQVFTGHNLNTGAARFTMVRQVLINDPLKKFNEAAADRGSQTVQTCEECLKEVAMHLMPKQALLRQKRYMKRHCRKDADMTIREFATKYSHLNDQMVKMAQILHVGDDVFDADRHKINDDDLLECLHNAIPNSWRNEMIRQKFHYEDETKASLIEFCERMELTEGTYNALGEANQAKAEGDKKPAAKKTNATASSGKGKRKKQFCKHHGVNYTHDTNSCRTIAKLLAGAKGDGEPEAKKPKFTNKTWQRNGNSSFDKEKFQKYKKHAELNAFVVQTARNTFKTEMAAFMAEQKKAASTNAEAQAAFNVEEMEIDVDNFNKLENSDDESLEELLNDIAN